MINLKIFFFVLLMVIAWDVSAQSTLSKVWAADNGDGTYKNPIINADYSDPDAIRVGDDFYMISSSFEDMPGFRGSVTPQAGLQQWRSHTATKKRRQRRCMSETQRP